MTAFALWTGALLGIVIVGLILPFFKQTRVSSISADTATIEAYRSQIEETDATATDEGVDAERREALQRELKQRLLTDITRSTDPDPGPTVVGRPQWALALIVAATVLAGFTYAWVGTPSALNPPPPSPVGEHKMTRQDIEQMIERLTARLKDAPGDVESWLMLARTHTSLGNFNQAASAYDAAAGYAPSNPNILADYADVLAMSQGKRFDGEPDRLIARALQADPRHLKALALSGTSAFSKKDYRLAIERWNAALALVPAESQPARSLRSSVGQAEAALSGGATSATVGQGAVIRGTVAIDAKFTGRFEPDDVVFVFARPVEGPRIPLAVARLRAGSLPAPFELNDSMSMNPSMKLSRAGRVQLEAKVSRSGSATPAPGDLFGVISPVAVGSSGVSLRIEQVRP